MDNAIPWFIDKGHWLILIGIILAVLGAFYNAFGLDKQHKLFGGLTQSLSFGLAGGIIIGTGLGLVGISFVTLVTLFNLYTQLTFTTILSIVSAFSLIGVILGIIFGFLVGLRLNRLQNPFASIKTHYIFVISTFEIALIIAIFLQIFFLAAQQHYRQFIISNFLHIPLFAGGLLGFMFNFRDMQNNLSGKRSKRSFWFFVYVLISINFVSIIMISLLTTISIAILTSFFVEFLFGYFISVELNEQQKSLKNSNKPSWKVFFLWSLLGAFLGIGILLLLKLFGHFYSYIDTILITLSNLIFFIGILIGVRKGRISGLLLKTPIKGKLSINRDKNGIQSEFEKIDISWQRFITGSLVGFIIFGLYLSSLYEIVLNLDQIPVILMTSLIGGIPISIMLGSLYGFGPFILCKAQNISDDRLGQIGVFLTVVGIILLALPSLIY